MKDYQKDNLADLDALLNEAADKYNFELSGSILDAVGATGQEIKDGMFNLLNIMVPEGEVGPWLKRVEALMA